MIGNAISRRAFLKQSAVLLAAGLAASCGATPTPTPTPAPAKPQAMATAAPAKATVPAPPAGGSVQYWVLWGANYTEAVWKAVLASDRFKEVMAGNTVEIKGGAVGEPLLTAVAAGTPPDAASGLAYLDYMARGVLRPLDDWVAASKWIKPDDFVEAVWKAGFYENKLYGIPANGGVFVYGFVYNARLAEAAKLDPAKPPQTWEEAFQWHKALTKFDSNGNLLQIGVNPYDGIGGGVGTESGFLPSVSWGWKWFDGQTRKFDLNNSMMAEAFDVFGEFVKLIGPDKLLALQQSQAGFQGATMYRAEVLATIIDGSWRPGHTAKNKPEVSKVTRASWVPVISQRRGVKAQAPGGNWIVVFKEAKNLQGAFRLAEFFNTPEAHDIIYKETGWVDASKSALKAYDASIYPGLDFFLKSATEATEWHMPAPCEISAFVKTQYSELAEAVYRGKMKGAQAAEEFQKRCEKEYKAAGFAK